MNGEFAVTLYTKCQTAHLTCRKHFQSKCRNIPRAYQEQVSNSEFAYTKQSHFRDVSEGLDDFTVFIKDAGFPVLDTVTASHFAFASSRSLRSTDLFDIIPSLKFLQKQNNLLGLLVAFNFIFSHQSKLRNFLNKRTQPALVTRGSQCIADRGSLLHCVQSAVPTSPGLD